MKTQQNNFKFPQVQIWLFGAIALSLGVGAVYGDLIKPLAIILIPTGAIAHAYGMFKIYGNK